MFDKIYLASNSKSRQALLAQANLPYEVILQNADEEQFERQHCTLEQIVTQIAQAKMAHAILPAGKNHGEIAFVLTADTMGTNLEGQVFGKPKNQAQAIAMLTSYRQGAITGTAFCLQKRVWQAHEHSWRLLASVERYVSASYVFNVPDEMLELYFKHAMARLGMTYLDVSGAVAIEDYGLQFVTNFTGSFTTVMGLPLYELRQELTQLGFRFS